MNSKVLSVVGITFSAAVLYAFFFRTTDDSKSLRPTMPEEDREEPPAPKTPGIIPADDWILNEGVEVAGNRIGLEEKPLQSSKFSAMYLKQGPHSSKSEFTIRVEEGKQIWIGWGPKAKFGSGWTTRAMMYGGNLSDGGGLLRQRFGPGLSKGDVVTTQLVQTAEGRVQIRFIQNGRDLGVAFDLESLPNNVELFPVISFSTGPSAVSVLEEGQEIGPEPERSAGMAGDWVSTSEGNVAVNLVLSQETTPNHLMFYGLSAKIGNSINSRLTSVDGTWKADRVASTMMMPPPEIFAVEQKFVKTLETLVDVKHSGDVLEICGAEGCFTFKRSQRHVEPVSLREVKRVFNL